MRTAGGRVATTSSARARLALRGVDGDANDEGGAGEREVLRSEHDDAAGRDRALVEAEEEDAPAPAPAPKKGRKRAAAAEQPREPAAPPKTAGGSPGRRRARGGSGAGAGPRAEETPRRLPVRGRAPKAAAEPERPAPAPRARREEAQGRRASGSAQGTRDEGDAAQGRARDHHESRPTTPCASVFTNYDPSIRSAAS